MHFCERARPDRVPRNQSVLGACTEPPRRSSHPFSFTPAFPDMLPSASHSLFRGGYLFERRPPLCSKVSPSFLFLSVTLKSFLYLFTPR